MQIQKYYQLNNSWSNPEDLHTLDELLMQRCYKRQEVITMQELKKWPFEPLNGNTLNGIGDSPGDEHPGPK